MNQTKTVQLLTAILCCLLFQTTGCQKKSPGTDRVPFEEGIALKCPDNSRKIEVTNTSYPEYYCIGEDGRTGTWLEFDVNGRLRTRATYVRDKMDGPWISYHTNGSIDTEGQVRDGARTGSWTQYYVSGKLRSIKHYENNMLHGRVELHYNTGGIMARGDYENDFEEGTWQVFTPEGRLARECVLEHGEEKECQIHIKDFQPASKIYPSKERGPL